MLYSNLILSAILGLASATPPMGFNNWSRFQCDLNQTLFTDTADAMAKKGLLDAGYDRINLDDCWPKHERAENGTLQWDDKKFPDGLIWLGQYLKKKGFKFGIYSDVGNATCGDYPGSYGYEKLDAETFASWGIDYLKLDGCNVPNEKEGVSEADNYINLYHKWHEILSDMENPLNFSESAPAYFASDSTLDEWYKVMDNMPPNGELARHSWDVINYGAEGNHWDSVMKNYAAHILLARYQSKLFTNDPDFLIADDTKLSLDERKSQFALWASFSAPLIISAYVPDLEDDVVKYLTNEDIIAVDQDSLGLQANVVSQDGEVDLLTKDLDDGSRLLTVFNRGDKAKSFTIPLAKAGFPDAKPDCPFETKELWSGEEKTVGDKIKTGEIKSHATKMYRITAADYLGKCRRVVQTGQIFTTTNVTNTFCLTGDDDKVTLESCNGKDNQIWQMSYSSDGTINNLNDQGKCLTEEDGGKLSYKKCDVKTNTDSYPGSDSQKWSYNIHGYVINKATENCLTMSKDNSTVSAAKCKQNNDYGQTFAAPIAPLVKHDN